ncbi:type VII secretion protein EssC [Lachnospiraceae bacterium 42-17]
MEKHIFGREENITISAGTEAVLRISGLKSRLYIRGMKGYADTGKGEPMYQNRKKLMSGEFSIEPGDFMELRGIKVEVWEEHIAVSGPLEKYTTTLLEQSPKGKPFEEFPVYKRSPRFLKDVCSEKISVELPRRNEIQKKTGLLMTVLPPIGMFVVTAAAGLLMGRGIYMMMTAMATIMTALFSGVRYFDDWKGMKKRRQERGRKYISYLWQRQREMSEAYLLEQGVYESQYPDMKEISRMVREYNSRIYERISSDEDFLTVSVGSYEGKTAFGIDFKKPGWDVEEDMLTELAGKICRKYSTVSRPKIIDLKKAHLGIVGEKSALHQQLCILISQTAFFQSYHDIRIIIIYDEKYEEDFAWMRWLPHVRIPPADICGMVHSGNGRDVVLGSVMQLLKERVAHLENGGKDRRFLPHYLFVIDESDFILNHGIMEYLSMNGGLLGFSIIYTSSFLSNLPEYIGTVLALENSREGTVLLEERAYKKQRIMLLEAEGVNFEWLARDISVLEHEQGVGSCIPDSITFFEMYGVKLPEELNVRKRWEQNQSHKSLAVPVGMRSAEDILYLNLHERAHGPHGLVAGTTGSGKSEFIQSYILSLAVNFHPHEAGFLLIDYKGGGMAGLFEKLPHHLGTITNLDGSGSMRALKCVKAELSRRQRLFRSLNLNHINGYMRLFKEGRAEEPVPHLFIISDEFAELRKEQPDFMKELISAARIGRSLGVHLILATQKPAGVVDDQIWSNSKFKVCLKVQDENDSREVLKTPDAAGITLPGRAYLQVGNNETYELFQSALSGAVYQEAGKDNGILDERVYVVNELGQGELINRDLSGKMETYCTSKTQLEAVTEHIRALFDKGSEVKARGPWLPPLGYMLISPYVEGNCKRDGNESLSVCIGKMDIPELQEQKDLVHSFKEEGNLLLTASSGFGKTVFLTTVLTSLALLYDVEALNFYILDYGNNGCMPLKRLPHTAEYITSDDDERYGKFKKLITEELAYRRRTGDIKKIIIVAVDQLEVVRETGVEEEDFFTRLTRDGSSLGIYTAATTTRITGIRQAILNSFKNKIAGYNFDENETFLTVGRAGYKQTDIKGRVLAGDKIVHEAQLYVLADCEDKALYSSVFETLTEKIRHRSQGKEAPHISVLPDELTASMLGKYANDGSIYLVGLDTEEVAARGFGQTVGMFVIVGNTGTGKTNMLKVLIPQVSARGRTYVFDTKGMELYHYRLLPDVLYVEGASERAVFMKELLDELSSRRKLLKEYLERHQSLSPKQAAEKLPFCTIVIDDLDEFTESIGKDLEKTASFIKEGIVLGITCIITVHAGKSRGMTEMDRLVKQAANGLVLSSQGVMPIFPAVSMRELPKPGDGLLFKNSVYTRVRLPKFILTDEAGRPRL